MDFDLGGQNKFIEFLEIRNAICEEPISQTSSWWGIILADAVGVVAGAAANIVSTGGVGAVPNPAFGGLPTAGAVGIVTGAAASVTKAI